MYAFQFSEVIMTKKQVSIILFVFMCSCFIGCYRMPTDEDFSVVPSTNNPDITGEKQGGSFMPNVGF